MYYCFPAGFSVHPLPTNISDEQAFALLVEGDNPIAFEMIVATLESEGIPFLTNRLGNLPGIGVDYARPPWEIRVPASWLEEAKELLDDLFLEKKPNFCPLCKAEHFEQYTECTDCGLRLVSSPFDVWIDPPTLLWCGHVSCRRRKLEEALRHDGIPVLWHRIPAARREFVDFACVLVRRGDFQRARGILSKIFPEQGHSVRRISVVAGFLARIPDDFYPPEGLGVEVWTGERLPDGQSPAELFKADRIPFEILGPWVWFVPVSEEAKAREVLREAIASGPLE